MLFGFHRRFSNRAMPLPYHGANAKDLARSGNRGGVPRRSLRPPFPPVRYPTGHPDDAHATRQGEGSQRR